MKTLNKQNQHELNINIDSLPEWSNYIAMDEDGDWYAYEKRPTILKRDNYWSIGRYAVRLSISYKEENWEESLYKIERNMEKHKWYNEIIAFGEGRTIEARVKGCRRWEEDKSPQFGSDDFEFRVKPEPKYIPFTFEDREVFRGKWVRRKKDTAEFIIHNISRSYVNGYSFEEALDLLEFLDGTPFGRLEGGSNK